MEKCQVVFRLLVPADQQSAKPIQPGMCAFDHPPAGFEARFPFDGFGFFPAWPNMGREAELLEDGTYLFVIVAFI